MVRDGIGVPFMALAGLLCLALLLSGCGTTYISAPDYGGRYDTSSLAPGSLRPRAPRSVRITVSEVPRPKGSTAPADLVGYRQHGSMSPRDRCAGQGGYGVGRGIAMRPGDILVFDTNRGRTGLHTALYTGNGRFVHSPTSGKRVREDSLAQEYWKKRLIRISEN